MTDAVSHARSLAARRRRRGAPGYAVECWRLGAVMPPTDPFANDLPDHGLSGTEAARRLVADGPNEIARATPSPWALLAGQFKGADLLLLGACVISALLGEVGDAIAIGAILLINAIVGFLQEYRAERAVLALRSMTAPHARVRRDGHARLPASEVVPGDVLLLEAGTSWRRTPGSSRPTRCRPSRPSPGRASRREGGRARAADAPGRAP